MRLSQPIPLQTLAGGIAGLIVTLAFFASPLISPVVFYGWYALAGAIYGAAVGLALRALLPAFSATDIAGMSGIVAAGFFATIFIAITLNQQNIVPVFISGFIIPPIVGIISGTLGRMVIAHEADVPKGGSPGFFWGALVFGPSFFIFLWLLVGAVTLAYPTLLAGGLGTYMALVPGTFAGALGGWLSGSLLVRRIRAAYDEQRVRAVQDTLTWQAEGSTLTVVDAPKEKSKGKPKSYPGTALALPYRVIAVTGVAAFVAAWLVFSTLPTLSSLGSVPPPFVPATWQESGVYPTPTLPMPLPQYAINQKVLVANLDPSLQSYADWWVNNYYWQDGTWIYEVRTADGITINRTQAQISPAEEPTAVPIAGLFSRESWDWRMPLALAQQTDTIPEGTLVHIQSDTISGGEVSYIVRDFIGRTTVVRDNGLLRPEETYVNPTYVDGVPLFGTAQGRIRLATTLGTLTEGTVVQIENAYFDTRTAEWFYYVRLPDGGRMPLRESDLTSVGLSS